METNGKNWIPGSKKLPESFIRQLVGHLSAKDKGNLLEVHSSWAKYIIGIDPGLRVIQIKNKHSWSWIHGAVREWKQGLEGLVKRKSTESQQYKMNLYDRLWLCNDILDTNTDNPKLVALAVVDSSKRLQAYLELHANKTDKVSEIMILLSAPSNSLPELRDAKHLRARGAGTLAVAAAAQLKPYPIGLTSLDNATSFYRRVGFNAVSNNAQNITDRLTPKRALARLGHLAIKWVQEG